MKNSSDTIGNRTRNLPTCSAVPQPTALLRANFVTLEVIKNKLNVINKNTCSEKQLTLIFLYECEELALAAKLSPK